MSVILTANRVSKRVDTVDGELCILKGIDLEIKSAESLAIIGASGSGKSTLLALLAGLDLPTEGQVCIDGQNLNHMTEDQRAELRGAQVGFVSQSFHLLAGLTALENVMLPIEIKQGLEPADRARQYLDKVGLSSRLSHYPRQLSGGEQQRVAIARAFASAPKLLFADEPTGNLDTKTGATISDLLFQINQEEETTLVLVTHDQSLAQRCESTLQLDAGSIVGVR